MPDLLVKKRNNPASLLLALLWVASIPLGLWAVYELQALTRLSFYAIRGAQNLTYQDNQAANLIGQISVIVGGIGLLAAIIGTGEFYMKHAGERKSWKIAIWILGVEILLIILGLIFVGQM